jgi:hypothetical protein
MFVLEPFFRGIQSPAELSRTTRTGNLMNMLKPISLLVLGAATLLHLRPSACVLADEGMWLFNDLPRELLLEKYQFAPSEDWAQHIMLSSVRFSSGGSASFISSDGLVLTNHHVAADTLHKLSTPENNYTKNGFLAHALESELKAPDLELNQLVSIEDVTDRVNAAVAADMSPSAAKQARKAAMARIEQESLAATGLRSDVITLFGGAKYHLYRYKKYTDVRLVWAPEADAAFFGGDADNFEYPRYCLDVAFFRVYENGKPIQVEHFLKWSDNGAGDGEVVFVSGNPGKTQRGFTTAALKFLRDYSLPHYLDYVCRMEIELQQFSDESPEHRRRALDDLFGYQNSRKAVMGMEAGLQNPTFFVEKLAEENKLREQLRADEKLKHFDKAWNSIAEVQPLKAQLLKRDVEFRSRYFEIAMQLVILAGENEKPNEDRFPEYRDSGRESLEHELFSPAPIYDDLDIMKLASQISTYVEDRGGDDPLVQEMLAGKAPHERAMDLISQSELNRVEVRKELAKGGMQAIAASEDPMIQFFLLLEQQYRLDRQQLEEIEEIESQAYAQIDEAKVALLGTSGYPDATFTLRLALGIVKGYEEEGQKVPPWTTIGGAFQHEAAHESRVPWRLPESWNKARDRIEPSTRLNFVCTADIVGGNSGSPVVNRAGEFVGIIFDGNIQSLTASYFYSDEVARAVCVHSSGIREALRTIYGATELAEQLGR